MNAVLNAIARHGAARPGHCALTDGDLSIDYRTLHHSIGEAAACVRASGARVVALALDNSPAWVVADLAALAARIVCVPVPLFFSALQKRHLLHDAGVDCILTDQPGAWLALLDDAGLTVLDTRAIVLGGRSCTRVRIAPAVAAKLPALTTKITYTSGTTGTPKGVCLRGETTGTVASSLVDACELKHSDRHASLLPLATLLENIGVYAHLTAGGCCAVRPLAETAPVSAARTGERLMQRLAVDHATTAILVPEMLRVFVEAAAAGIPVPPALRLLAVGGARVSPHLVSQAHALGLPVFEGYGLSECASVVTLNTRRAHRPGTAGRPLPHVEIRVSPEQEVLVRGALFDGYVGDDTRSERWYATGDRGTLDSDGFLRLTGRSRHVFITSHGRNVSPEWIESELTAQPAIAQAWVHGEARPWNAAVIVPRERRTAVEIDAAIAAVNATLPDYARVTRWIPAAAPFSASTGELTANGRLRRDALLARYAMQLHSLYPEALNDIS